MHEERLQQIFIPEELKMNLPEAVKWDFYSSVTKTARSDSVPQLNKAHYSAYRIEELLRACFTKSTFDTDSVDSTAVLTESRHRLEHVLLSPLST